MTVSYIHYGNGLLRITAPHFCAGLIVEAGWVSRTAPILSYMYRWTWRKVVGYCDRKGWEIELVSNADMVERKTHRS